MGYPMMPKLGIIPVIAITLVIVAAIVAVLAVAFPPVPVAAQSTSTIVSLINNAPVATVPFGPADKMLIIQGNVEKSATPGQLVSGGGAAHYDAMNVNSPTTTTIGTLNVKSNPGNAIAGYFEGPGSAGALSPNGPWTVWRSYGVGRAAVFDIQAYNSAGTMIDQAWVSNAGLQYWDAGKEQSDIDIGGYRDGALDPVFVYISAGCLGGVNTAGNNAGHIGCPTTVLPNMSPGTDNIWTNGTPNFKWKAVYTNAVVGNVSGSPPAGAVGEIQTASVACASPVAQTSGNPKTIVLLPLGPGTWDITGTAGFVGAATTVVGMTQASISATFAVIDAAVDRLITQAYPGTYTPFSTSTIQQALPTVRVSSATSVTYNLVEVALFATSTLGGCGSLRATRVY
jgi:hypothetical protein